VPRQEVQTNGLRRRRRQDEGEDATEGAEETGRQFVVALARGLAVLSAFRSKDMALGNGELAERTGLPTPTVSRLTYTLHSLGYLSFDARRQTYDLGSGTLALGHTALARLSVRRVAIPLMQKLADESGANVGLGVRDRQMMLYADTCEGSGLIGLRLFPGSRVPIVTSAMGRAYLSALSEADRNAVLESIAPQYGSEWPSVVLGVQAALRDIAKHGFCMSLGEWQKEIHGIAVPLVSPSGGAIYAINLGGPAYLFKEAQMRDELGPKLVAIRNEVLRLMSP
jgi:DNA-binding IclR family transcriptional regulator